MSESTSPLVIGSDADFVRRLQGLMPIGWFSGEAPIRDGVLAAVSVGLEWLFEQNAYAALQTRLQTSTDIFLDLAAADYLATFPRRLNEPDAAYSLRIRKEIIRPRNTRAAIVQVLQDLTGNTPTVFRPSNAADTGAWGVAMGYGVAGAYGSLDLPFQAFVAIERGTAPGAGAVVTDPGPLSGYGAPLGGWGIGALCYGDGSPAQGGVTDTDIYNAVASVTPDGHINWVQITGAPSLPGLLVLDQGHLDLDYLQ